MALSEPRTIGTPQHFLECDTENCEKNCQFYCNTCHIRLCEECRDEHLRSPETKDHEVVVYQQRRRQLPVKKCKIHPTRNIDLLCEQCKVPLCSKCTTTPEHRGHTFTDLETIYADKFLFCQEEIIKIHEYFLPSSQELKKNVNEDVTEIKNIIDNIIESMKSDGESLKNMVDTVVSENVEQVKKIGESVTETLKGQDQTFDDYITCLHNLVKQFNGYLSDTDPMKLISKFYAEDAKITSIPETTKPNTPIFTPGKRSKEDVAKLLGKVVALVGKAEIRKIRPMEIPSNSKSMKPTMKPDKEKSKGKQTLSLTSSVTKDREFKVAGVNNAVHISLDHSGRLWVSDCNGNLVQTDLQGNQLQKINTSCGVGYHTVTQDGDLIFTDKDKNVINRIRLDNNITEFINTGDWAPTSIYSSHFNGDILVGKRKDEEAKVTRYNNIGKELQNLQRDDKGRELYRLPLYITENINGDICTSDWDKGVVVLKKSGQHRFSYKGQKSEFNPCGICTDVFGHILVCDIISESVHLLDQNGQFLSLLSIRQEGIEKPCSVFVDNGNNLYVGQGSNVIVTVFNCKYLQ